ncbi:DUF2304 domain-containing protein [Streptomyces sp. V2]|uniref:DUF2304 domain-containing protein n=2 Tax=Streptomyces TaxID=1883 RepID=A0ABW9I3G6_9ACTN|nr:MULTISPECIES: DUF2304 domain-containing protein [Streptomyces]PWG12634.1 DUF2304 domain-containing protein [Streptomyces sp. V2]QZZ27782.1 DUF2304 domain-containing protein [Streptomyces sp. ST1015]
MQLWMLTSVTGVFLVLCIVELLRRRKLKEKYAFLWVFTGMVIIPLGFFPSGLDWVARNVGVRSGVSLILFLSVAFLFIVCLQLSWEVGHLEEEGRTLSEEVALLRIDVQELRQQLSEGETTVASGDSGRLK